MLALSLRATSQAQLEEILDAWFAGSPSDERDDVANVEHLAEIERAVSRLPLDAVTTNVPLPITRP